jgi:hypothetical protein
MVFAGRLVFVLHNFIPYVLLLLNVVVDYCLPFNTAHRFLWLLPCGGHGATQINRVTLYFGLTLFTLLFLHLVPVLEPKILQFVLVQKLVHPRNSVESASQFR